MLTHKSPVVRMSSKNLRLLRRIAQAADKARKITMTQMVNIFNSQGRKIKSPPNTYIAVTLLQHGYLRRVAYNLYEVTNKIKRVPCL